MIYVYRGCNGDPAVEFDLDICLAVPSDLIADFQLQPPTELKTTAPFKCLAVDYVGPMSGIGQAWMKLVQHVRDGGYKPTEESREIYKKWVSFDSADNVTELQQGIA
jgi:effector-binding domain-containing protein